MATEPLSDKVWDASIPSDEGSLDNPQFALHLLHTAHHELRTGDTLVIIDFPQHHGAAPTDCRCVAWCPTHLRVSSDKIRRTGSAKFASLLKEFGLRASQKARKLDIKPEELEGVKYIMDLTPNSEGDDIVFQMTELSLTPGIMDWWKAVEKHGVDAETAGGHDDVCNCWAWRMDEAAPIRRGVREYDTIKSRHEDGEEGCVTVFTLAHKGASDIMRRAPTNDMVVQPPYRDIPDYCPIRHRLGILRLLFLIEEKMVVIDSAPRLWTLVAVSKIFECAHLVLPWVRGWLSSRANSHFIEVLPEEALRISVTLKFVDVTKCAFRILVNEMALDLAADQNPNSKGAPKISRSTLFGRKRADPGDDLSNAVEYAARALVDRVTKFLAILKSDDVLEQLQVKEWTWLMSIKRLFQQTEDCLREFAFLEDLEAMILGHWKIGLVEWALNFTTPDHAGTTFDDDRALYVERQDFLPFDMIYHKLNDVQKLLLSPFYENFTKRWQEGPFLSPFARAATGHTDFQKLAHTFNTHFATWRMHHKKIADNPLWQEALEQQTEFDMVKFDTQLTAKLTPLILSKWSHGTISPSLTITRHLLLNLEDNELKYLPLWAGGNDDGTGGVFIEESIPPPAFLGPSGPGPSYHTGYSAASDASSTAASISSDLREMDIQSTVGPASMDVQDSSASTIYNRKRVVADNVSIHSETFTDGSGAYRNAQFEIPADNQSVSSALAKMIMDDGRSSTAASQAGDGKEDTKKQEDWDGSDVCEWEDDSNDSDDTLSAIDWAEENRDDDMIDAPVEPKTGTTDTKAEQSSTKKETPSASKSDDSDEDMVIV